jgi:hypothetical protein
MEWKIIGLSSLINATLTIFLSLIFFPLFILGPFIGGFLSSYISKGYEYYAKMDKIDGAVVGAVSGIIGGIIIGLLSILGFGDISAIIGSISTKIGLITVSTIIQEYFLFQFSVATSFVFGLVGGVIGVIVKY